MSPRHTVATAQLRYEVLDGDRISTRALLIAPLVDKSLPEGVGNRRVRVEALSPQCYAHVAGNWFVVTGRPELAVPNLDVADAFLDVRIMADGLPSQVAHLRIPQLSPLPFIAAEVVLDTPAFAVAGRVTEAAYPHAAIGAAAVSVQGNVAAGDVLGLRCPLSLPHDVGTTVRTAALANVASTTLVADARAGDLAVHLASTAAMLAGRVLAFGPAVSREHAVVDSVDAINRMAFLRTPLVRSRSANTAVSIATPGAPAAPNALARAAHAGDGVVITAAVSGATVLEIADAVPARTEYRLVGCVAGPDGYWRLDGVRGLARLDITTSAAGFLTAGPTTYSLDPDADPNLIDVQLAV